MQYTKVEPQIGFKKIAFADKVGRVLDRARRTDVRFEVASWRDVAPLLAEARNNITLAPDKIIKTIASHNPDILRVAKIGSGADARSTLFAYLPLNEDGMQALSEGRFNGLSPDIAWICRSEERPSAVYLWLVYMPGALAQSLGVIAHAFDALAPSGCPVFSRAVNAHAERLNRTMGFMDATQFYPESKPGLLVVFPGREVAPPKRPQMSVRPARDMSDMMQVFAVRSATYIAEQYCLYEEEFDGNDFCATQFIGFVDGDPAGCIRVRYFSGFAKIERLAVRTEYRNSRLAFELVRAALSHCRKKGFSTFYGHSRLDLVRFWRLFGFRERQDSREFSFANVRYIELVLEESPLPDAISLESDPMVLIRPEGLWDVPGPLDRSRSEADPARRALMEQRTRTVRGQSIAR